VPPFALMNPHVPPLHARPGVLHKGMQVPPRDRYVGPMLK
jgi:hypothetical protein